jgi:hypothetical protein
MGAGHNQVLRRFFELEDAFRVAFDDVDGRHFEGYPLDVESERVLFGLGGPMAPEQPEWFLYESIRVDSLYYWSESAKRWLHFEP